MLVRLTITGAGLRTWLEKALGQRQIVARLSGIIVTYDSTRAPGRRVISVTQTDGRPIVDTQSYRFIYSDFLNANGDGLRATEGVQRVEELGIVDIDALIDYVRRGSPVWPPRDVRVIARTP
jgi:2',3'-cyclic-nucleotide 2'-phosphodiesterase (5'-nucleotidase family)